MRNLFALLTITISVVLPIIASVYLCMREKRRWKTILLGVATFVLFQICIRLPLLQGVLMNTAWFSALPDNAPLLYALILGASAALFEVGGRYVVMALLMKKQYAFGDGIAFGVGHGGIEAILLVGLNTMVGLLRNSLGASSLIFAAGLERLFTMVMQVAFSVLVVRALREKQFGCAVVAFGVHASMDTLAAFAWVSGAPVWVIETALGLLAMGTVYWLIYEWKKGQRTICEN